MNYKQLSEFFGKSKRTIERIVKKLSIPIENGKEKILTKEEVELIANELYKKLPLAIKESINMTFNKIQPTTNDIGKPTTNDIGNFVTKDELKEFGKTIVQEMFNQFIPLIKNNLIESRIELPVFKHFDIIRIDDTYTEFKLRYIENYKFKVCIDLIKKCTAKYNTVVRSWKVSNIDFAKLKEDIDRIIVTEEK